jgi:DMSO/TMAO reductase YedYZ molybdopterin-dependent catalytic subunit
LNRLTRRLTRRRFLYLSGGAVATLAAGCGPARAIPPPPTPALPPTSTPRPAAPTPAASTDAAGGPLTPDEAAAGIPITPNERFYTQSYKSSPQVDVETWRLTVDGLVERPLTLAYDDIRSLPSVVEMRTVECISNPAGGPLIGNAVWEGVRLGELLGRAGVKPEAARARFEAADGYYTDISLERVAHPDTLLVYRMNGDPLPAEHGFPLRILLPGLYGQKMPKWITRIQFTDRGQKGYWESQGWSDEAVVKTSSRIVRPQTNTTVGQPVVVSGVSYGGDRAIVRVEVGIDGAEWHQARLTNGPNPYTWSSWQYEWAGAPGKHTLLVRATDESGFTQEHRADDIFGNTFPDGTAGIHWVVVEVVD